jgi:hypothetical protein
MQNHGELSTSLVIFLVLDIIPDICYVRTEVRSNPIKLENERYQLNRQSVFLSIITFRRVSLKHVRLPN